MVEDLVHRFYREHMHAAGLISFQVIEGESDLFIWAGQDLADEARVSLCRHRGELEDFIAAQPMFETTYRPYAVPEDAPEVVALMAWAAERAGVGPMAAVAGAIAEQVGRDILPLSPEIIVENGGDIFIHSEYQRRVGIYAGESPLSGKLALLIPPTPQRGLGVCTSSATVGPSYSAGKADVAMVVAESAALADAAATALGNRAKTPSYIEDALSWTLSLEGIIGCLVIIGEHLGVRGPLELEKT
jgi:ApbE superfamily uncharacterized protein (UPF0280 family)